MSGRQDYAEKFAASAEAVWGAGLAESRSLILKTGEAVYDVDNAEVELRDEPATRSDPGRAQK